VQDPTTIVVCSVTLTRSPKNLLSKHTQHIINCTRTYPNCFQSCGLSYLRVGIADEAKEDVSEHFTEVFDVIEEARSTGGACLVHCNKGMSRSAILVLAFLVAHCNLSAVSALQLLQQKRPAVSPNPGFLGQLLDLELRVRGCISLDATKVRATLMSKVTQIQTAIASLLKANRISCHKAQLPLVAARHCFTNTALIFA
jgi:predicted protein tyrosine phosphatase